MFNSNNKGFGSFGSNNTNTSTGWGQPANNQTAGFGGGGFGTATTLSGFNSQPQSQTQQIGGFGATTTSGFGAGGFGQPQQQSATGPTTASTNNGTGNPAYSTTSERETTGYQTVTMHAITYMTAYRNWSLEELRLKDYELGKKGSSTATSATGSFGFGAKPTATATSGFGTGFNATPAAAAPTTTTPAFGTFGSGFGAQTSPTTTTTAGAFGAPQPAFGGGAGGFGQPQAVQSGFGTGFGQTTTATSGFGGGFGQTAQTSTPGFGLTAPSTTTGFGQQPAQQQPGLFGTNTSTTGGFQNAGTTGGFGQPANNTGTSLFGQPQQQTTSGFGGFNTASSGFGSTQTQQQQSNSGFGGFGGQTAQKSPFGAGTLSTAPASTTGNLFGQQTTQPAFCSFGQTQATTQPNTSLFGSTNTGGFGQPSTTTPSFGTNLFAPKPATTTQSTSGLFSSNTQTSGTTNAPSFSFGATNNTTSQPQNNDGTWGGFNSQQQQPSTTLAALPTFTLGGSTNQHAQQQQPLNTSLFQTNAAGSQPVQQVQGPALTASIDSNAYGTSALLQPKEQSKEQKSPQEKSAVQDSKKFFPPHGRRKLDQISFTPRRAVPGAVVNLSVSKLSSGATKPTELQRPVLYTADQFVSKSSVKKLDVYALQNAALRKNAQPAADATFLNDRHVSWSAVKPHQSDQSAILPADLTSQTPVKRLDFQRSPSPLIPSIQQQLTSRNFELMENYTMTPPLQTLLQLSKEDLCAVQNFSVSHSDYGSVQWLEPVDLSDMSTMLHRIPGEVVLLTLKACEVYPNSTEQWWPRHNRGQGLNRAAEITLYRCRPNGADSLSPQRLLQFVEKLKRKRDTHFISYDSKTGEWKFRVEHFSRYGVDAEDEEFNELEDENESPNKQVLYQPTVAGLGIEHASIPSVSVVAKQSALFPQATKNERQKTIHPMGGEISILTRKPLDDQQMQAVTEIRNLVLEMVPEAIVADQATTFGNEKQINQDQIRSTASLEDLLAIQSSLAGINKDKQTLERVSDAHLQSVEAILQHQLASSKLDGDCRVSSGHINFGAVAQSINDPSDRLLWLLVAALIDPLSPAIDNAQISRKMLISKWLEEAVVVVTEQELKAYSSDLQSIMTLLLGHRISEASQICLKAQKYQLAAIVAQLEGFGLSEQSQVDLENFLDEGHDLDAHETSLYSMLVNDFAQVYKEKSLDWKRCFGLYFWYFATEDTSLRDVLLAYENDANCTVPQSDTQYLVLRNYVFGEPLFKDLLSIQELSPHMVWNLLFALPGQIYNEQSAAVSQYSAYLDSVGLWKWSIFVAMSHESSSERRKLVQRILQRHLSYKNDCVYSLSQQAGWSLLFNEGNISEQFDNDLKTLKSDLLVPDSWIYEVQAFLVVDNHLVKALYLYLGGFYNAAHQLVMEELIDNLFIDGRHKEIMTLLNSFVSHQEDIIGWSTGGGLYLQFLNCIQEDVQLSSVSELLERLSRLPKSHAYEHMASVLVDLLPLMDVNYQVAILKAPLSEARRVQLIHDIAQIVF